MDVAERNKMASQNTNERSMRDKAKCIDRIINLKMTQKPSEPKLWATNAQTEIVTTRICCLVLFASSLMESMAEASDSCLQQAPESEYDFGGSY